MNLCKISQGAIFIRVCFPSNDLFLLYFRRVLHFAKHGNSVCLARGSKYKVILGSVGQPEEDNCGDREVRFGEKRLWKAVPWIRFFSSMATLWMTPRDYSES